MDKMDRRRFVRQSVAVVGFPTIVSSAAIGRGRGPAAGDRVAMGCIGVGGQGTYNLKSFLADTDVRVTAVCDVDAERRQAAQQIVDEKYGEKSCRGYNDFRELLERRDIDAVTVCTPDHWHGLISIAAAKAGKDIYCEKPLTNTVAEGRSLVEAVRRYGRILQTGTHERSRPNARYACELVRNGRIGRLKTIRVNLPCADSHHKDILADRDLHPPLPAPPGLDWDLWMGHTPAVPYHPKRCHFYWRFILDYGGGEMTDRGAHILDIGQLGNDTDHTTPIEYQAYGEIPRSDLYNTFFNYKFECLYANGVRLIGATDEPRGIRFEGSDGWIFVHIHGGNLEAGSPALLKEILRPEETQLGRSPGHHRDFINSVIGRRPPMAPVEVGHHSATICHLLNIAMLTGRKLRWDPEQERILDDPQAHNLLARPMRAPWSC